MGIVSRKMLCVHISCFLRPQVTSSPYFQCNPQIKSQEMFETWSFRWPKDFFLHFFQTLFGLPYFEFLTLQKKKTPTTIFWEKFYIDCETTLKSFHSKFKFHFFQKYVRLKKKRKKKRTLGNTAIKYFAWGINSTTQRNKNWILSFKLQLWQMTSSQINVARVTMIRHRSRICSGASSSNLERACCICTVKLS